MEPVRLKLKDFYSIADGEIDFTKFSSALILGQYEGNVLKSNGSGKSSCLEGICWALFNESRQEKKDDVIRWSATDACVEFEFIFDRRHYKIVRRRSRVSNQSAVSLFVKENGKWVNDSGSIPTETDKKIISLLKIDSTIFLNSVYFKQHDIALFANSSPGNRKEIIKAIMKLEQWDEYQKDARDKLKLVKESIEKQDRIVSENGHSEVSRAQNESAIEATNDELQQLQYNQKKLQSALHSLLELKKEKNLTSLISSLQTITDQMNEIRVKGKKTQNEQTELQNQIESNNEKSRQYTKQIMDVETNVAELNEQISGLKSENCDYKGLEDELLKIRVQSSTIKNRLIELKNTSSMVDIGQCKACLTNITKSSLPHIHANRAKEAQELNEELKVAANRFDSIDAEYNKRRSSQEEIDAISIKIDGLTNTLDKLKFQKQSIDDDNVKLNNHNILAGASLIAMMEKLKAYKIDAESVEVKIAEQKMNNIDTQIVNMEDENIALNQKINAKSVDLGILLKEKEFIANSILLAENAIDALVVLGKKKVSYEQLVRMFGKDGIQAVFIESIVDELERYANETLAQICNEPTIIKLRTQKKVKDAWSETLEIDVIMNGHPQTFESLGGGERFRISLALRIGLSEVLVKRAGGEIKMLLLDEVDSPLDAHGVENLFANIIKGLENRFKVLVISHNSAIQERFENTIMVKKTSNGSFVNIA
jgi:DNA repair exonuclease SbcCD ATPase subunit